MRNCCIWKDDPGFVQRDKEPEDDEDNDEEGVGPVQVDGWHTFTVRVISVRKNNIVLSREGT